VNSKKTKEYCQCSVHQTAASAEEDRHANINFVIPMQDAYWNQLDILYEKRAGNCY